MSPITSIRTRLQSLPDQLLSALAVDQNEAKMQDVLESWAALVHDVDEADRIQSIDEDTAALISSVSALIYELSSSFLQLETDITNSRVAFEQALTDILPTTCGAEQRSTGAPRATTSSLRTSSDVRCLSSKASISSEALYIWLLDHIGNPYPNKTELTRLARAALVSTSQLASFLKRLRERSEWNKIVRHHFGGNRSATISAATQFFTGMKFDTTSRSFKRSGLAEDAQNSVANIEWRHAFNRYADNLLDCYKRDCLPTTSNKRSHCLSPNIKDRASADIETLAESQFTIRDVNEHTTYSPAVGQGMSPMETCTHVLRNKPAESCTALPMESTPQNRKRSRTISRASSLTPTDDSTTDNDTSVETDSTDCLTLCRPAKRTRINRTQPQPSTNTIFGSHSTTSLSRLDTRSMIDLHAPTPVHSRVRRNSETALTAPWPIPEQSQPLTSVSASHISSDLDLLLHGPLSATTTPPVTHSVLIENPGSCFDSFDFTMPSSEEARASLHQQLDTYIDVNVCDPSVFDLNFPDTGSWNIDSSLNNVNEEWDLFNHLDILTDPLQLDPNIQLSPSSQDSYSAATDPYTMFSPCSPSHLDFSLWEAGPITTPTSSSSTKRTEILPKPRNLQASESILSLLAEPTIRTFEYNETEILLDLSKS